MKNASLPHPPRVSSILGDRTKSIRAPLFAILSFAMASTFAATDQKPANPQEKFGGFSGGIEIFDTRNLDRPPEIKLRVEAQYPFEMRRAGVTGEVVVEFIVDSKGGVVDAFAVRSSQREFEANAVAAVRKWKFKPGQKAGRDVNTRMQVPILFSLEER